MATHGAVGLTLVRITMLYLGTLGWAADAWAWRCDGYLIKVGDRIDEVHARCGEPVDVRARVAYRSYLVWRDGVAYPRVGPVVLEEWTYNFGANQFLQRLYFENGYLVRYLALPERGW